MDKTVINKGTGNSLKMEAAQEFNKSISTNLTEPQYRITIARMCL